MMVLFGVPARPVDRYLAPEPYADGSFYTLGVLFWGPDIRDPVVLGPDIRDPLSLGP